MSSLVDDIMVVGFSPRIARVRDLLETIDGALLRCLRDRETSVRVLSPLERFSDVDASYRWKSDEERCVLGLFNPKRNHIVLRDLSGGVLSHEAFHAIDFELGEAGRYRSQDDPAIVAAYAAHRRDGMWVSAYSSVAVHELAAEAGRSVLGFSMSSTLTKRTDAERLRLIDPQLMDSIDAMVVELRSRYRSRLNDQTLTILINEYTLIRPHQYKKRKYRTRANLEKYYRFCVSFGHLG